MHPAKTATGIRLQNAQYKALPQTQIVDIVTNKGHDASLVTEEGTLGVMRAQLDDGASRIRISDRSQQNFHDLVAAWAAAASLSKEPSLNDAGRVPDSNSAEASLGQFADIPNLTVRERIAQLWRENSERFGNMLGAAPKVGALALAATVTFILTTGDSDTVASAASNNFSQRTVSAAYGGALNRVTSLPLADVPSVESAKDQNLKNSIEVSIPASPPTEPKQSSDTRATSAPNTSTTILSVPRINIATTVPSEAPRTSPISANDTAPESDIATPPPAVESTPQPPPAAQESLVSPTLSPEHQALTEGNVGKLTSILIEKLLNHPNITVSQEHPRIRLSLVSAMENDGVTFLYDTDSGEEASVNPLVIKTILDLADSGLVFSFNSLTTCRCHKPNSDHYDGAAADITPNSENWNEAESLLSQRPYIKQVLSEGNHLHFAQYKVSLEELQKLFGLATSA